MITAQILNRKFVWKHLALCLGLTMSWLEMPGLAQALDSATGYVTPIIEPSVPQRPSHSLGHKLLFYLPNRFLDLLDMVRLRARVGPGLAADARMTMYAANFVGTYRGFYFGLPGPRLKPILPPMAGREQLKGLLIMGIDATDDSPHPPQYTDSEVNLGGQLLILGLDTGFDPVELGDFLAGFILIDVREDDL